MNTQRKLMATIAAVMLLLGMAGSALAAGERVWWKFDESSGTTASDSSGNNNAGTLTNMAGTEWTAGKLNNSLNFDGVNDYVVRNTLSANITGDCTVSVWMNRSGVPSTNVRLMDLATAGGSGMQLVVRGTTGYAGMDDAGGLTSKLFWDNYDFTRDPAILRDLACPALLSMARFLTKTVRDYDGRFLASFSASPEQMINGPWAPKGKYYQTVGCAFDQQMIRENGRDLLAAAALLGERNETVEVQQRQIDHYDPVQIGWSGQIKEYEEENFYGEIGEYRHRHISQLMALHPGTLITRTTPAWLDAQPLLQAVARTARPPDSAQPVGHAPALPD